MNPDEIVVHVMQGQRRDMVFDLFGERVRQASEAAHLHPHREILALNVTGVDVLRVWRSDFGFLLASGANGRAVALLFSGIRAVDLHQHGIVDIFTEAVCNGCQVAFQSISSKLHAIGETAREVLNKLGRASWITPANQPGANELAVSVNGYPSPDATDAELIALLVRNVLILGTNERPNFITLNALTGKIHQRTVEVFRAGRAEFDQQLRNSILRCSSHPHDGANRATLNQRRYDLCALFNAQLVHIYILNQSSIKGQVENDGSSKEIHRSRRYRGYAD